MSHKTPYRSILLYYGVGVGKTCSAITIAELMLSAKLMNSYEPTIWVIMPQSLKGNFKSQIFDMDFKNFKDLTNQCTGNNYIKLLNIDETLFNNKTELNKKFKETLNKRYKLFTYDSFSKYISKEYKDNIVDNKIIIIDEAHNIRSTNNKDKDSYIKIKEVLLKGKNNRLILLSATPMYNEPRDILDLFNLMLINDKRLDFLNKYKKIFNNTNLKIDDDVKELIKKLSSNYISYLKGRNPFTFALKLNPSLSDIKVLENAPIKDPSNKLIPKNELLWYKHIKDDIITSKLGIFQKSKIKELYDKNIKIDDYNDDLDVSDESEELNKNMKLLQPMNIVYDDTFGEKGFYKFFTKTTQKDPISIKYNKQFENALYPEEENLGKYSGKFLNMCNFIRKSNGIVIIYSRFLYSGIIPFAICLEHLGYNRYGANNILQNPKIVQDIPKYEGVKNPKYCILTSDKKEIMGNTNIDGLIKIINNDKNINGENIKIILITPVASEGLSFFNAREIHLIEPWYHFNRPEQIIGRGIRNCRHQKLPFEKRNVTVFIHASLNDNNKKETIDIHALRISTRKYRESQDIDNIITNNAIDCALMKNINYFPKSIFQLGVIEIETSQGKRVKYELGDDPKYEPICSQDINIDKSGYKSERYKHLLKMGQKELKNQLEKYIENNIFYIEIQRLIKDINIDEDILMYTIYKSIKPNILLENYYISPYRKGIKLNKIDKINYSRKIKIVIKDDEINNFKSKSNEPQDNIENIIKLLNIDFNDIIKTIISIYLCDSKYVLIIINHILHNYKDINDNNLLYIAECLYKQGILIKNTEIPSFKYNNNKYIGYYNIYNIDIKNKLEDISGDDIILYDNIKKIEKVGINETYTKELKQNRIKISSVPEDMRLEKMPYGIILPINDKSNNINNIIKIFSTDTDKGMGRTCRDWNIKELNKFTNQLDNINIKMKNKDRLCNYIAELLMKNNRLLTLPIYKPKIK
jgi:hypothetical protein